LHSILDYEAEEYLQTKCLAMFVRTSSQFGVSLAMRIRRRVNSHISFVTSSPHQQCRSALSVGFNKRHSIEYSKHHHLQDPDDTSACFATSNKTRAVTTARNRHPSQHILLHVLLPAHECRNDLGTRSLTDMLKRDCLCLVLPPHQGRISSTFGSDHVAQNDASA